MSNGLGVTGTDGHSPIYDPEGRFQVWAMHEIYQGEYGENRYVPKVKDLVKDMDTGLEYRVVGLDLATLIPTLDQMDTIPSGEINDDDLLLGVGPGTQSDTYRVYLDKSVIPYSLAVDARLSVAGTMAAYARIFKGADLTDQGNIVSLVYDSAGNIIGNKIPLELVAYRQDEGVNIATKTIPVCQTMANLQDGEIVTTVIYSDVGHVVSKRQLLVENTAFIRTANLSTKYITDISMECPFLSGTDPRLINLPINVTLSGLNIFGVVHYSDGTFQRMPIDGTKFAVLGLDSYLATWVDNETSVSLRYRLSAGEVAYGSQVGEFAHLSETYKIKTIQQDGAYSVKLYCYPVWLNAVDGYTLRWYLYNSDRDVVYNVTGQIEYALNSPAFNPIQYGVNQRLNVAVNLQAVNGAYRNYRHAQTVEVVLWRQGTERQTNWTVGFEMGQNPPFGDNNSHAKLEFVNTNLYRLDLSNGATTQDEWLERMYYRTKPIIDQERELVPPIPSHFRLRFGNFDLEFPIESWNLVHQVGNGLAVNGTVFIEFIQRTPLNDLQLSVAALPLWPV